MSPSRSAFLTLAIALAPALAQADDAPRADGARTTQALKALPRRPGERVAVTIYEFRSSLPAVSASAVTDMFKTALVQSGRFAVVERSRLNEGVVKEKQLQQGGFASGSAGQAQLRGAQYVFEGVVSEANASEHQRSSSVSVAGMQIGGGSNRDSVAIDVRVVDASSGEVVDAITVKRAIRSENSGVSGVGSLVGTVLAQRGHSAAYAPDVNVQDQRREGVDAALRDVINQAVLELAQRFPARD